MCDDDALRLARAIGDEAEVDWDEQGADSELGRRLRRVEAVATAFRQLREDNDEPGRGGVLFRWGHLEVLEQLGEGAFGEVFRARDPRLERDVALKLRRRDPAAGGARVFVREARKLARLRHPNVLEVYGADIHDGRVGLWVELVEGESLEEWLESEGNLDPHVAVTIGVQLCRALAAVHGAGLVHGDVKAGNVLREHGGRLVLADFGTAQPPGPARSGTPLATAPEVLEGDALTPAADLYSLGVLLFRLLSGRYPVDADSVEELRRAHGEDRRTPLVDARPDCPVGLVRVVDRVLAREPSQRFASAGEMEAALASALEGGDRRSRSRRPSRPLVAALVVAAAASMATVMILRQERGFRPAAPVAVGPVAVDAGLYRVRDGAVTALAGGEAVGPGDHLYLEVEAPEPVHLYVLNEDAAGEVFVLFPLPGLDVGNPLQADRRYRLPGRAAGVPQDWTVTSAGGRELFLVVASRQRLAELERQMGGLEAAAADRPVEVTPSGTETLRGVGGLGAAETTWEGTAHLDEVLRSLGQRRTRDGSVWVTRIELANPR
jgi:hypothetical protein